MEEFQLLIAHLQEHKTAIMRDMCNLTKDTIPEEYFRLQGRLVSINNVIDLLEVNSDKRI